jgi:predicted TIM-barrel fold metal-dependent hydrolase
MAIVDSHLHVWRAAEGETANVRTIVPPQTDVPLELARETMVEHRVDRAVLVQPVFRGEDNSYVAQCAHADPEKFAAVCVIDPCTPGAEKRLEYWASQGCRGLRLRPRISAEAAIFADPATYSLWDAAQRLGVVVSLLASPEHAPAIGRLAERYAEVPIVIDHLGHPNTSGDAPLSGFRPLLDLARHSQIYLKLSGFHHFSRQRYPYLDCWPLVRAAYEQFGPERLMWGSDFPHVLLASSYGRSLTIVNQALMDCSAAQRESVMGTSALRLYWPRSRS